MVSTYNLGRSKSLQSYGLGAPVIDSIEQKLERPVRLTPERDLRAEEKELALADSGLGHSNAVL